jgi:hypothetical protein
MSGASLRNAGEQCILPWLVAIGGRKKGGGTGGSGRLVVVAGVGFEPTTFGL